VTRRPHRAVTLLAQEFDEPGSVLDLLIENTGGHVERSRVLAECEIADLAPAANGALFRLQWHGQNLGRRGVEGQVTVRATGPISKLADVARDAAPLARISAV